jgi:hypothetical protein
MSNRMASSGASFVRALPLQSSDGGRNRSPSASRIQQERSTREGWDGTGRNEPRGVPAAHLSVAMRAGVSALEMRPRFFSPPLLKLILLLSPILILPGEGADIERRRRRGIGAGARGDSMRCDARIEFPGGPELPFPLTSRFLLLDPQFNDEWLSRRRAATSDGDELTETGRVRLRAATETAGRRRRLVLLLPAPGLWLEQVAAEGSLRCYPCLTATVLNPLPEMAQGTTAAGMGISASLSAKVKMIMLPCSFCVD